MFSFCHVRSHDHMMKGTCDLISRSPLPKAMILPGLVVAGVVEVEIQATFLIFNVTLQGNI